MARRAQHAAAAPGEGGPLARPHTELGMAQRRAIIKPKASEPLLTDAEIAARIGCSPQSVGQVLKAATADLQPVMRTYVDEMAEAYRSAVLMSAATGRFQGPRAFLIDAGLIPRQGADNRSLTIT